MKVPASGLPVVFMQWERATRGFSRLYYQPNLSSIASLATSDPEAAELVGEEYWLHTWRPREVWVRYEDWRERREEFREVGFYWLTLWVMEGFELESPLEGIRACGPWPASPFGEIG